MARYLFRCESCTYEEEIEIPMDAPKDERPCILCWGVMARVYTPTVDVWKDAKGNTIRSPGKQWVGGETFDRTRFYAENPSAKPRRK
jgi:hypothetical protein